MQIYISTMSAEGNDYLSAIQSQIFDKIAKNDIDSFKQLISQCKNGVNFVDENGMSPLQHASCKGNKTAVAILLDMGADINFNHHGANYTPLHFAALSGNKDVCRMLLNAGINPNSVNSVSRTASQMAAFVGNHACVETINNYIALKQLEYYTKPLGSQKKPLVPESILRSLHAFIIEVNLHPVRIALNLQSLGLLKHLPELRKTMELLCEKEMKKTNDINDLLAFKFHYLGWIIFQLLRCEEQCKSHRKDKSADGDANKNDFVEMFVKRVLKENKQGHLDYIEFTLRDCIREFAYRDCSVFRQIVSHLGSSNPPPALSVIRNAINGYRGFAEEPSYCKSCGNERPDKKCSKCKAVQYCDRECQRLHWFMHKKSCTRPVSNILWTTTSVNASLPIATIELRKELAKN